MTPLSYESCASDHSLCVAATSYSVRSCSSFHIDPKSGRYSRIPSVNWAKDDKQWSQAITPARQVLCFITAATVTAHGQLHLGHSSREGRLLWTPQQC